MQVREIEDNYIKHRVLENSETERKNNEIIQQKKEEDARNRPCISCYDAKESVKRWALEKEAQGISITYASSEWNCVESKKGCTVSATFYMNSETIQRDFFVDCKGNAQ